MAHSNPSRLILSRMYAYYMTRDIMKRDYSSYFLLVLVKEIEPKECPPCHFQKREKRVYPPKTGARELMQNHFRDQPRQGVPANMALTLKPTLTLIGPAAGPRFSRHLRRSSLSLATFRAPPFRQCARVPRPDGRFWATRPAESDHMCLL